MPIRPALMATAASIGLPSGPLFLLLGVDPILDMGRTALNVLGTASRPL